MNWDAIDAIGEILGASAVVASLVYLAVQIRHNTKQVDATNLSVGRQPRWGLARFTMKGADLRRKHRIKHAVVLVLAGCLCQGCMFEAQRAFGCNDVGLFGCKDEVPPPSSHESPPREAEARAGVLSNNRDETDCLPEQREVDACIEIYQPVCATVRILCVTTPCDPVQETFSNSCEACMNSLVSAYTDGACPDITKGNAQGGHEL